MKRDPVSSTTNTRPGLIPRSSGTFAPAANNSTFKEVLIFEERLKQNAERLQRQRRKYEVFLVLLLLWSGYLTWVVFVEPSIYSLVHYSNIGLLLVSLVTLVLFFATGIYADKIAYAYKFVPQTNRALRPFNIYLNTRPRSFWPAYLVPPFLRPQPPLLSRSNSASSLGSRPSSPTLSSHSLSRRTSSSSTHSSGSRGSFSSQSVRSTGSGAMRSPPASPPLRPTLRPSPSRAAGLNGGVPLAPIPPPTNARGELIFSSRVSAVFREGYERYRSEWERRREEQATVARAGRGWMGWLWGGKRGRSRTPPRAAEVGEKGVGSDKEGGWTGMRPGVGSRVGSRQPSTVGSRTGTPLPTPTKEAPVPGDGTPASPTTPMSATPASSRASSPVPSPTLSPRVTARTRTSSAGGSVGQASPVTSAEVAGVQRQASVSGAGRGRVRAESFSDLLEERDDK